MESIFDSSEPPKMYFKCVTADTDPFQPPCGWLGLRLGQREPVGALGVSLLEAASFLQRPWSF